MDRIRCRTHSRGRNSGCIRSKGEGYRGCHSSGWRWRGGCGSTECGWPAKRIRVATQRPKHDYRSQQYGHDRWRQQTQWKSSWFSALMWAHRCGGHQCGGGEKGEGSPQFRCQVLAVSERGKHLRPLQPVHYIAMRWRASKMRGKGRCVLDRTALV